MVIWVAGLKYLKLCLLRGMLPLSRCTHVNRCSSWPVIKSSAHSHFTFSYWTKFWCKTICRRQKKPLKSGLFDNQHESKHVFFYFIEPMLLGCRQKIHVCFSPGAARIENIREERNSEIDRQKCHQERKKGGMTTG